MNRVIIALLITMITITIALAGIKKGNIEKDFHYDKTININKDYQATLGPYYQLWANAGYTYIGTVKDATGKVLSDTEIGDLAEQYYREGHNNYWAFDEWLRQQGYTLENFQFHSDPVLDKARNLVNNAQLAFENELITAFGSPKRGVGNDWERTNWPGRNTGIYDIKTGSQSYSFSQSEGDINISGTATFNYHVNAIVMQSPIVLDINGDGKLDTFNNHYKPIEVEPKDYKNIRFREFDISSFGYNMLVEHIGFNDGYLVKPKDTNLTLKTGKIEADEMFGTAGGFEDGFQKLSLLDTNKDGKLTDNELNGLYVFIDKNMNNRVEKGELISVKKLGITEIGVNHNEYESYYIRNGKKYKMWDFWPITLDIRKTK
ncbi:MAG: hypothetical protein ACP5O4_01880 [bacterium]